MASISLITSFRDRDTPRVRRFLDSLASQSDQAFELIFLDYGSRDEISEEIRNLCSSYDFCRYIYNHTRGMEWNRAHALNSAARFSRSSYLLFTDVDLIFSGGSIARIKRVAEPGRQYFCRAFFLPGDFDDYASLNDLPVNFRLTSLKTKGLFHCVERSVFEASGGFDEYFSIWGFEDTALAQRFRAMGITTVWLDSKEAPMYHQWHPSSARLSEQFPPKWWEDMVMYMALLKQQVDAERGRLLTESDRPSLRQPVTTSIRIRAEIEPHGRARAIRDIIFFLENYPGKVMEVCVRQPVRHSIDFERQSKNRLLSFLINTSNRWMRRLRLPLAILHQRPFKILKDYTYWPEQTKMTPENIHYVLHRLIKDRRLVKDYSMSRDGAWTIYKIVG